MNALLRALALVGALWSSAACAQESVHPALYVARDADSTLYLFGTVHVRPPGVDWGDAAVREAIEASDEVWTEIEISPEEDARAQALMRELSTAPAGRPLSSWLTSEERGRFNALLGRLGVPVSYLDGMQPWAAGLTLTIIPIMQAGYDPESGVDRAVDAYAEARRKRMRAFETIEDQLGFLSGLSPELQHQMLLEAIDEAELGPPMLADMSRAWERGDEAVLEQLVVEDTREDYPELYEVLFLRRNAQWIDTLMQELDGAGVDFVAVGAGHLVGEDGLVAQLRARGVAVERVRSR
ncbi:MAG: TraB/GumN family protein [Hyphomonadaceae bacterium]|nr:TraB/GumN family protein [Hyphomonadaceae bacterium]